MPPVSDHQFNLADLPPLLRKTPPRRAIKLLATPKPDRLVSDRHVTARQTERPCDTVNETRKLVWRSQVTGVRRLPSIPDAVSLVYSIIRNTPHEFADKTVSLDEHY